MSTRSRPGWMRALLAACTLGIAALFVQAQSASADLTKNFDTIVERLDKARKEHSKSMENATDEAEQEKLQEQRPGEAFIPEFQAVAREAKGTEVAAKAWMRVAEIAADFGRKPDAIEALDTLMEAHIASPALESLPGLVSRRLGSFLGKEKTEKTLRTLIEKSPHKTIQAASMFTVASSIVKDKKATPERTAEARALMAKLQKEYVGVVDSRKQDFAAQAEAVLFEMDFLQIGKVAPDFEVTDENGVKFKLSDYRGKVVVVDFWGNW